MSREEEKHFMEMPRAPTARFLRRRLFTDVAPCCLSDVPRPCDPERERDATECSNRGVGCYLLLLAVPYFRDDFCEATGRASLGHLAVSELEHSRPFCGAVQVM